MVRRRRMRKRKEEKRLKRRKTWVKEWKRRGEGKEKNMVKG